MDTTKTNDVAELTKLSLKTFLNIGQMARYRYLYTYGKELQKDCPAQLVFNQASTATTAILTKIDSNERVFKVLVRTKHEE